MFKLKDDPNLVIARVADHNPAIFGLPENDVHSFYRNP